MLNILGYLSKIQWVSQPENTIPFRFSNLDDGLKEFLQSYE